MFVSRREATMAFADNPLIVLSYVTGPALLTNATSLLLNSTTARFGRAIDRSRNLAVMAARADGARSTQSAAEELALVQRRLRLIAHALSSLYFAAATFALSTLASIVGAVTADFATRAVIDAVVGLAVVSGVVGFGAFSTGALFLVAESRLAVRTLATEAADVLAAVRRATERQ
jgi:hypothetical protein